MPTRLFDDDETPPAGSRTILPTVPPLSLDQGLCALVVCLQAALAAAGQTLSYARLMGLLGPAFMFRMAPGFPATAAVVDRQRYLTSVLCDLGWQPRLIARPDEATLAEVVAAELGQGRPLLVQGWPPQPLDWALIFGLEGQELLGRWPGSGRGPQRGACAADLVLALGASNEPVETATCTAAALARAVTLLDESQKAFRVWADLLAAAMPYGPPLGRRDRVLAEQWLVQCLADARWAGQEFLQQSAELFPEAIAEGLGSAADCCAALAEQVEMLLVPSDAAGTGPWLEEADWLGHRRDIIVEVAAREAALADLLRRALDGAGAEYVE